VVNVLILMPYVSIASAQFGPPGFGPPGFGPPGMGGPGMGPPGMGGLSMLQLAEMVEVQTELKLSEEQKGQLGKLSEAGREKFFEVMGSMDFPSLFEKGEDDRQTSMKEFQAKIEALNKENENKLQEFLTEDQIQRARQLKVQRQGLPALLDESLSDSIKLSDEQTGALKSLLLGNGSNPMPGFGGMVAGMFGGRISPQEQQKQAAELESKAMAILSAEQRATWVSLQGPKFSFPSFNFGGPGRPMGGERKLLARFDTDKNKRLDATERLAAREQIKKEPRRGMGPPGMFPGGPGRPGPNGPGGSGPRRPVPGGPGQGGPALGPPGMFGRDSEPVKPGPKVEPASVKNYANQSLYAEGIVRTLFLTFENEDWEKELADFYRTDVDVSADLMVDGTNYAGVGVHFRGMSSFGMVGEGRKRSLNISMDHTDSDLKLYGKKTLNLLNAHDDPSFLNTVLYLEAARKFMPAPKANFVHVVINGESWGLYTSAEQFNKEFTEDNFGSSKGARWKVSGSPMGRGGLENLGDEVEEYKKIFSVKSKDNDKSWRALMDLCRILNDTPADTLASQIEPILDVEGTLKFLALEVALVNNDGYWIRASDYCLYLDEQGMFHTIIHDANETFRQPMGPGFGMGPGGPGGGPGRPTNPRGERPPRAGMPLAVARSPQLDPLVGINDLGKPLRSKLLAVPEYKERYLGWIKRINDEILEEQYLKGRVEFYANLIDDYVKNDTRKLSSYDAFRKAVQLTPANDQQENDPGPRGFGGPTIPILEFAKMRREYLNSLP
jgi:hypothetical protein